MVRKFFYVSAGVLFLAIVPTTAALAGLRSPQVPVLTGRLQSYLNGVYEFSNVNTDQLAAQSLAASQFSCNHSTFVLQLELGPRSAGVDSIGVYNASEATPQRMLIFPPPAVPGWFAVLAFRRAPVRLVVNVFDLSTVLRSTTVYLGADETNFGFWEQGPAGAFFLQDARNPASAAQMLMFAGTGVNSGCDWICMEDHPVGAGSDQDYADAVVFVENICEVPVRKSTWGAVKTRFR